MCDFCGAIEQLSTVVKRFCYHPTYFIKDFFPPFKMEIIII